MRCLCGGGELISLICSPQWPGERAKAEFTQELKSNKTQSSSTLIPQSLVMGSAVEAGKTMFGDK